MTELPARWYKANEHPKDQTLKAAVAAINEEFNANPKHDAASAYMQFVKEVHDFAKTTHDPNANKKFLEDLFKAMPPNLQNILDAADLRFSKELSEFNSKHSDEDVAKPKAKYIAETEADPTVKLLHETLQTHMKGSLGDADYEKIQGQEPKTISAIIEGLKKSNSENTNQSSDQSQRQNQNTRIVKQDKNTTSDSL